MSVAERMAPISSSEGSLPADRICHMVAIGQAKHSIPSNRVDHAQMSVMVRPRHHKNPAAAISTRIAPKMDSWFEASQAPTATTRPPKSAFIEPSQSEGMGDGVRLVAVRASACRVIVEYGGYTVRLTKNAAA